MTRKIEKDGIYTENQLWDYLDAATISRCHDVPMDVYKINENGQATSLCALTKLDEVEAYRKFFNLDPTEVYIKLTDHPPCLSTMLMEVDEKK